MGVLFWAGRTGKVFSLEIGHSPAAVAGCSITQPCTSTALLGQAPTCPITALFPSYPSTAHSSPPSSQFAIPVRPKLSILGQLLYFLASISEQGCSAMRITADSLLKSNKASHCVQ